ncbi:FAD binding domain-containing protein [Methylobacterium aquaticum]|uniref:FAD binding domain-containing protein n=1 Tax=Methylobacterium aquaticum TaxID=270351 RepID=UPI003D182812
MKPAPFEYLRPTTIEEALAALAEHADRDAKILAGGQSLVPMMNFRVVQPAMLIDLNRVAGLAYVHEQQGGIAVGAMTRHSDVKAHPLIARHVPLVRMAYEHVAHGTVRNRGTLGGNLVHADPASEMPAVMLALDARLVLRSSRGARTVDAADFFVTTYTTLVEPDEILIEIRLPRRAEGEACAFEEVSLRKGDFAMSAVGVRLQLDGDLCGAAAIALAGVSDTPLRAVGAERLLIGQALDDTRIAEAAEATVESIDFSGTASVSAGYRRDITRELVRRALSRARTERIGR